jgi:hypothetical protein
MQIKTIGSDRGKAACDVVAMDERGKVVMRGGGRAPSWSPGWAICRHA